MHDARTEVSILMDMLLHMAQPGSRILWSLDGIPLPFGSRKCAEISLLHRHLMK